MLYYIVADYDTLIFFQAWPDWLLTGPIRLGLYCTVISRPALAHGRPRGVWVGRSVGQYIIMLFWGDENSTDISHY